MSVNPSARPLLTVSIPTRNRAALLRDCLQSVLTQSLTDIEVVVSDNASTDETADVVTSFGDPRVRYTRTGRNIGLPGNVTRSLGLGTAPLVTLLADDEVFLPDSLARRVELLERHPEVDMVHSALRLIHIGPNDEPLGETVSYGGGTADTIEPGAAVVRRMLTEPYFIHVTTVLARRSVIENNPWEEADGPGCDIAFCLRAANRSRAVAYVAEPLGASLVHPQAASIELLHEFEGGAWRPTLTAMANLKHLHKRFLAQFGSDLEGGRALRRGRERYSKDAVMYLVKQKLQAQRSPRVTWRLFRRAVRIEPGLLLEPAAMKFFLASMSGARGRRLAHRVLGHKPRASGDVEKGESRP